MTNKEFDCGSWGWYFDDDERLSSNQKGFMRKLISISFKYGINLSTFGLVNGLSNYKELESIVEEVFKLVNVTNGNQLQKAINQNFYSKESSSRALPSIIYDGECESFSQNLFYDYDSILFSTLKEGRFHSFFYNLRSNVFVQDIDDYVYGNTARFNSYLRRVHQLMTDFNCSFFDYSVMDVSPFFNVSEEGYIAYKKECIFYEDVYDLLPNDMKYTLFEEIQD